jgi:hypothetical protein
MDYPRRHTSCGRAVRAVGAVLVSLALFIPQARAISPPLKERAFFQKTGWASQQPPWIDLRSVDPQAHGAAKDLQSWLLAHQSHLSTWPPRYRSKAEITKQIEQWEREKKFVDRHESSLLASPASAALEVTFWTYGHNIDEPKAASRAFSVLDRMQNKFPHSPLPPLLRGMLSTQTGDKHASKYLAEAKSRTSDKRLRGMADLTLATRCVYGLQPHRAVMAFMDADKECASCVKDYGWLTQSVAGMFSRLPEQSVAKPYAFYARKSGHVIASDLFGYSVRIPQSWQPPKFSGYDPARPMSYITLDAAPLPGSGIVHGLNIFSTVSPKPGGPHGVPRLVEMLYKQRPGESLSRIKPLVANHYLKKWYRIDTGQPLKDGDTITLIVATGLVKPVKWTLADHARLAAREPQCEPRYMQKATPGKVTFWRSTHRARIDAPVRITVVYAGSQNTYKLAARNMKKIISKFHIYDHAGSEFFGHT